MPNNYLHNREDFPALLQIIAKEKGILAGLVEKDYWIMHVLFGLKQQGFEFELKGGTSLSKGYGIINRFSEDIDIHIQPPADMGVNVNKKNSSKAGIKSRKDYYDWLAMGIRIDGIISIERDTAFDNDTLTSGGIRLHYKGYTDPVEGLKDGILLEAGFDTVTPNTKLTISSWAFEKANSTEGVNIADNRAFDILCYHPGYTFVEKLQTIATKFRREQEGATPFPNLMRQYYDLFCLLNEKQVQDFIGTDAYFAHKEERFRPADKEVPIAKNEAFLLNDEETRNSFRQRYQKTAALYYKGQPDFDELIERIQANIDKL